MSIVITVSIISALSALLGAIIGAIPSYLQHRAKLRELEEAKFSRIHTQTIELIKVYRERIKLLKDSRGIYSTHDPPLYLYWIFYRALKDIEEGKSDLPQDIKNLIAQELRSIGKNPENYGL